MLKSILTQIMNRKRSNGWVAAELFLVFIFVWFITDYFFVLACNCAIPNHRSMAHTWQVSMAPYPPVHPRYSAAEAGDEAMRASRERILGILKNYPDVEAVAVTFISSDPENRSAAGSPTLYGERDTAVSVRGQEVFIDAGEDFFRVFNYTSGDGGAAVSVHDFDWSAPGSVVIGRLAAERLYPGERATGKRLTRRPGDFDGAQVIAGVVDDIKRYDYERPQHAFYSADPAFHWGFGSISIRSSARIADGLFREAFMKEMPARLQVGNFYFDEIIPYSRISSETRERSGLGNAVRERAGLMIFLLLNVLLCVTGTFFYRVGTRLGETGIRMAMGASAAGIRRMFVVEGLLLLAVAALPAVAVELHLVLAGLIDTAGKTYVDKVFLPDRTALRFVITNVVTWVVMASVIAAAVWIPARRAAGMAPAEALREE
ncbi:MAG: FtsX-like permease family protein [Tannerella sp.]|jgi:hypothetical protein|nr:FtsX-like permease family protein [Tannerella sp.]